MPSSVYIAGHAEPDRESGSPRPINAVKITANKIVVIIKNVPIIDL